MTSRIRTWAPAVCAAGAVIAAALGPALADDRDLLRQAQEKPYVFVVLDSSGSMNWQPGGDAFAPASADDPNSKMYQAKSALFRVMTDPDLEGIHWGFGTYNADSVRAYRKHWLYKARTTVNWANAGWNPASPTVAFTFPLANETMLFGDACLDEDDGDTTCDDFVYTDADNTNLTPGPPEIDTAADAALGSCTTANDNNRYWDLGSARERLQLRSFPILGDAGTTQTDIWLRSASAPAVRYRMRFDAITTGVIGDATITVRMIAQAYDSNCNTSGTAVTQLVVWDAAYTVDGQGRTLPGSSDAFTWQQKQNAPKDTDPWHVLQDAASTNTCQASGNPLVNPERNNDTTTDRTDSTYFIKTKTVTDPLRPTGGAAAVFTRGDFVPLDWKDDLPTSWTNASVQASHRLNNRDFILRRLAPNYDPSIAGLVPDFRTAPYFQDHPTAVRPVNAYSGVKPLAAYADVPPILANGSTPLGNTIAGFTSWFDTWKPYAAAPVSSGGDQNFSCRTTNLLILTDGDESCYGGAVNNTTVTDSGGDYNPCKAARELWRSGNRNVKTFIVGFGLAAGSTNFLNCIAEEGGTAARDYSVPPDGSIDGPGVILPGNEDQLVTELTRILSDIRSGTATFASAAVPSVQADAADKVVLTEFTPVKDEPLWPGKIFSFVKPVPILLPSKQPDFTALCTSETDTACFAWEAQSEIIDNQVTPNTMSGTYIGPAANQRRLYYSEKPALAVPIPRHYFKPTDSSIPIVRRRDLWTGLRIPFVSGNAVSENAAEVSANATMNSMLAVKTVNPVGASAISFVLGDNFHSDPLAIGSPSNSIYFRQDTGSDLAAACTDDVNDDDRRYTRYAFKQERRRRMLALGTNEGALHLIDMGIFRTDADLTKAGKFTNGTGLELIGFVPRQVLGQLPSLHSPSATEPQYTVDGKTALADVLIDPIHAGFGSGNPPAACDRRWRSVLIGGLREGGSSATLAERPRTTPTDSVYPAGTYYSLDLTNPDPVTDLRAGDPNPNHLPFYVPQIAAANETVPTCIGNGEGASLATGCGPVAFGTPLWEFNDSVDGIRLDEDDNGHVDLAYTWSSPNTGRIRVCTANCGDATVANDVLQTRYVAVFGGGIDGERRNVRGNWLYILDIETGQAIYKHRLRGSAAAEPAAVDTDFDGYLDRIYIGDIYGLFYRVDLVQTVATGKKYPAIATVAISETDVANVVHTANFERITETTFRPRVVFNATGTVSTATILSATTAADPRPIYYPASIFFVPTLEKYGIAVGTGNRFEITSINEPAGRFFTFTDDWDWSELPDALTDAGVPPNRSALVAINLATPSVASDNYLLNRPVHQRGWHMELDTDERLVSEPLAISGVLLFSMFKPQTTVSNNAECQHAGVSRLFGVFATNALGILDSDPNAAGSTAVRYRTVEDLTTSFFVEQTQTGNPPEAGQTYGEITQEERDILENVKQFLPQNCSFPPGYGVRVNTRTSRGGIESIAPIPLCVIETNYKEE
jgi:hypothetical protein